MTKQEWRRTPYAETTAKNTPQDIQRILHKYGVKQWQWTRGEVAGQPAIMLRFVSEKGIPYSITVRALQADASEEDLASQAQRALFYYLKALLEVSGPFFPLEEVLAPHLQLADGSTLMEAVRETLPQLAGREIKGLLTT